MANTAASKNAMMIRRTYRFMVDLD